MYVFFVIGLALVVVLVEAAAWGIHNPVWLLDTPSFLLLMIIGISMLLATGLGKDFLTAFGLAFGKDCKAGLRERQRAAQAVELFMKAVRYGAGFGVALQLISLTRLLEDMAAWGVNISVILILFVYAYAMNLLLLPVKSRLQLGIIEYMQEIGDAQEEEAGERTEALEEKEAGGKATPLEETQARGRGRTKEEGTWEERAEALEGEEAQGKAAQENNGAGEEGVWEGKAKTLEIKESGGKAMDDGGTRQERGK